MTSPRDLEPSTTNPDAVSTDSIETENTIASPSVSSEGSTDEISTTPSDTLKDNSDGTSDPHSEEEDSEGATSANPLGEEYWNDSPVEIADDLTGHESTSHELTSNGSINGAANGAANGATSASNGSGQAEQLQSLDQSSAMEGSEDSYWNELPGESEMSLFDHLEELRQRIFYALIGVVISVVGCFLFVNRIVSLLEVPAKGVKFLQLAPGEYFFVSIKVAGYSGILLASPIILYQIIQFVLPGLTRRERRFIGPIVLGSSVLFVVGIIFSYAVLTPAALNFFISYGEGVVEQSWSIDRYFEFVLLLLFSVGLAFQIPVIQLLLGLIGIVSSQQMLSGWRYVIVGAVILGAVLTPSTDPITQSLLGGAVMALYFGGIGLVKMIGR
jgi:sec-independent protein translocase protein TatC